MDDPDGAGGRGGNHWIAYDIPATAAALPRNVPPGVLKPGLTREQFMQQIQGHNLAEASIVTRYEPRTH